MGVGIVVTEHAITRYRQRVRPGLDHDSAGKELRKAVRGAEMRSQAPHWAATAPDTVGWVVLSDDVVLTVVRGGSKLFARTCLVRGWLSAEDRLHRTERLRSRRAYRRRRKPPGRLPHLTSVAVAEREAWR